MAAPAAAQTPPQIPGLPKAKAGDVARFKVTVSGNQTDRIAFSRDAGSDGCSLKIDGTLRESWNYARGKGVVFEFRKLFGRVVFGRAGRPGDGSFAAPGNLTRQATGSYYYLAPGPSCTAVSLLTPTCGKRFRVRSDLSLGFSKNQLILKSAGTAGQKKNPAGECGFPQDRQLNFDQLSAPFALLNKQVGALSKRSVFGKKPALRVKLKEKFLEPLGEGYTRFDEKLQGTTTVTLRRLP